jgi:hypothetical protein
LVHKLLMLALPDPSPPPKTKKVKGPQDKEGKGSPKTKKVKGPPRQRR